MLGTLLQVTVSFTLYCGVSMGTFFVWNKVMRSLVYIVSNVTVTDHLYQSHCEITYGKGFLPRQNIRFAYLLRNSYICSLAKELFKSWCFPIFVHKFIYHIMKRHMRINTEKKCEYHIETCKNWHWLLLSQLRPYIKKNVSNHGLE